MGADRRASSLAGLTTGAETQAAQELVAALDIRTTGLEQEVATLSGGNQQKVSLGKWLAAGCDILIVDEPTVGVDIQAKGADSSLAVGLGGQRRQGHHF